MKLLRWIFAPLICAVLLFASLVPAGANPPEPHTPDRVVTPVGEAVSTPLDMLAADSAVLALPPLKAVLLVGPIDGDTGSETRQAISDMELAANALQRNNVTVHKFYTPNNDWEKIKTAASGAHFLIYRGHGIAWSSGSTPIVGGFALKSGFRSSDDIRNELHLAKNAIVMLYGCYTAGSSSDDTVSVSSAEAQRRVVQYSDPFFDNGAGGYYANWFGNAFEQYINHLFAGKTLGQAYEAYFDFNAGSVERYSYPGRTGLAMWLDKDNWYPPTPQYNNAFIGYANSKLTDLFGPQLQLSVSAVSIMADPDSRPATVNIQVGSGGSVSYQWTSSLSPSGSGWVSLRPSQGVNGDSMQVQVQPQDRLGSYQAEIVVRVDNPGLSTQQTIPVRLQMVEDLHTVYVPLGRR